MTVVAFDSTVSRVQLKNYADVICFSQVGLCVGDIADRLGLPEHLVLAWVDNWRAIERSLEGCS